MSNGFQYAKGEAQDLTVDISQMSPLSLNLWMAKFVGEIGNSSGGRNRSRTLYQILCGIINRHIRNVSGGGWRKHVSEE